MSRLPDVTTEDLRTALAAVEGKRPTLRLVAGIAYKNGVSQTEMAAWFDVERKTVYNWLRRLEADDLVDSVTDANRSGRRRKLDEPQFSEFRESLREPPNSAGIDAKAWTPERVQAHLSDAYGVEYSIPSCRRLMREAGLRYVPAHERRGGGTRPHEQSGERVGGVWRPTSRSP